jgi:Ca2+-binding EF-hand superfamily protein
MGCAASTNSNRPNGRIPRSAAEIMFRKYDTSGDGSLSKSEFKKLCQSLGYKLTDQELEYDMKMLDLSGDGQISFAECNIKLISY